MWWLQVRLPGSPAPARVKLTLPPVLRAEEDFVFPLIVNMWVILDFDCLWESVNFHQCNTRKI